MALLALDTSLGAVSVAVAVSDGDAGGKRIARRFERRANGHAERLFDLLAEALAEAGVEARAIERVAVTLGPGTFTGVRTGVAVARAMVLATGCEVVGISSLQLMALGAQREPAGSPAASRDPSNEPLLVAVDARRGQVYVQLFDAGSRNCLPLDPPRLLEITAAVDLARAHGVATVVGSGAAVVVDALRVAQSDAGSVQALMPDLEPDARDLVGIAPSLAPLGEIRPLYIRPPDAKPPANPSLARRG